jgi:hypothetical protein
VLLNNSAIDIYQGRLVGIQDHFRYGIWIQYKLLVCSVDAFPSWEFQWHACNSQGDFPHSVSRWCHVFSSDGLSEQ